MLRERKKIGIFSGYHHPTLGSKAIVCSRCFNLIEESKKKYGNYVLSDFKAEGQMQFNNYHNKKLKISNG